ncbi:MAG: chemotaxis protein CheW [Tissierellia bacterium]|nr:chemotaxis protein CheW [Tissierellia bacterium]
MAENQFVVFKLGKSEFGIDIMNVQEISAYEESTSIPDAPSFIEGVLNYRGNVIPVINLKERLHLGESEVTKDTRIIVVNVNDREVGFIVDEASQTLRVSDDKIDEAPTFTGGIDRKYITGVGKLDDKRLLIIIDLMKILSESEMEILQNLEV